MTLLRVTRAVFLSVALTLSIALGTDLEQSFFPFHSGWLGADAAYSVPLDQKSSLWLLGDTFIGKQRSSATMIHNSVAVRICDGDCRFTYWWSGMQSGKPDSFFKTEDSNYYWPLDGFLYAGKLYCFLEQMHSTGAGGAFGFDYSGVRLATVANPKDPPDRWRISYRVVSTGNQVIPGIAVSLDNLPGQKYIFAFTLFRPTGKNPFVGLLRLSQSDLLSGRLPARWEYLERNGHWRFWEASQLPPNALELIKGNVTEMTVKFHPRQNQWLAILPTPGPLTNTASYSTATRLSGPWMEPRSLFEYREMKKADPRYTPNVFCYAAKEHPELESAIAEVAVTYACNSTQEREIFRDERLYRPRLAIQRYP